MHTANALLSPVCAQVHILRDQKDVAQDKHEDAIDFVNEDGDVYDIVNVEKSLSGEKSFGGEKSMGRNQWGEIYGEPLLIQCPEYARSTVS